MKRKQGEGFTWGMFQEDFFLNLYSIELIGTPGFGGLELGE